MSLIEKVRVAIFLWVILTTIVGEIGVFIISLAKKAGMNVEKSSFSKKGVRLFFHITFFLLSLCTFYGYFIEPNWLKVEEITLFSSKIPENKTLTIVQVSDLHSTKKDRNEKKLPGIINKYSPDIICLTGDYLNTKEGIVVIKNFVRKLKSKTGIYAVMGNCDVWYFPDVKIFKGTSVKVLNGNGERIRIDNFNVYIAGISYENYFSYSKSLKMAKKDDFVIFLYHTPDLIEEVKDMNIDLYLAGHTHGGQIALPFYGAIVTFSKFGKKYERGLYHIGNVFLYVNRGIGMEGGLPPLRFFSPPEVTVFYIKHK